MLVVDECDMGKIRDVRNAVSRNRRDDRGNDAFETSVEAAQRDRHREGSRMRPAFSPGVCTNTVSIERRKTCGSRLTSQGATTARSRPSPANVSVIASM